MSALPPPTEKPCNDCPWRRIALVGWLGPFASHQWVFIAQSDKPIACHKTILRVNEDGIGDWTNPEMRQCRGAAIFRANICKSPRDPEVVTGPVDKDAVFASVAEFTAHHEGER